MTFQPPPPSGPGGPPAGPPAGGWGPPPGNSPAPFDPKAVNPLDWGIIAAGFLAFVFSFVSYYTFSYGPLSDSTSAWHGFFGWFAALLAIAGSAVVAISLFAPQVSLPVPARLAGLGAYALATLCVIIALFTNAYDSSGAAAAGITGVDTGHGFGYWASLIVIIAGLALSLMRFQATGGQLPGGMNSKMPNVGGYGPQGGISGGQRPTPGQYPPAAGQYPPATGQTPPPPPPGYGPPQ